MKNPFFATFSSACLLGLLLTGCRNPSGSSPATAQTGIQRTVTSGGLELSARVEPFPLKLEENNRVTAVLTLRNRSSSKAARLEFATSQRFEVLLRDVEGKKIEQWSEDQPIEAAPGVLIINPREQVEYRAVLGTRELLPGQRYHVDISILGDPKLNLQLPLTPL